MNKSRLTASIIALITIIGPLQYSLRPDAVEDTAVRGFLMVLTIAGGLASLFIGLTSPSKS